MNADDPSDDPGDRADQPGEEPFDGVPVVDDEEHRDPNGRSGCQEQRPVVSIQFHTDCTTSSTKLNAVAAASLNVSKWVTIRTMIAMRAAIAMTITDQVRGHHDVEDPCAIDQSFTATSARITPTRGQAPTFCLEELGDGLKDREQACSTGSSGGTDRRLGLSSARPSSSADSPRCPMCGRSRPAASPVWARISA
jgi:hypothetical protein